MKKQLTKIALAVLTVGLLGSCSKINERLDGLDKRIDGLENERIASIESQIGSITSSIADLSTIRSNIKALTTTTESQGKDITDLQAADKALDKRIEDLKKYVDDTLKSYATSDWVKATFVTLEQYKLTCDTVAMIDAKLSETSEQLSNDIKACSDSLTKWINKTFEGYYTAAKMDAELAKLKAAIDTASGASQKTTDSLKTELKKAKADIDTAKAQITRGYEAAIKAAIEDNDGFVTPEIKEAIDNLNDSVALLVRMVDQLDGRVGNLESILQSITFVPDYDDGRICVFYDDRKIGDSVDVKFAVSPAKFLERIKFTKVKVLAKQVLTKAGEIESINVGNVKVSAANGTISLRFYLNPDFMGTILSENRSVDLAFYFKAEGGLEFTTDFIGVTPRYRYKLYCDTYEEAVSSLLNGVYPYMGSVDGDSWGFRPQMFLGCNTVMDVVSPGADKSWTHVIDKDSPYDISNNRDVINAYRHAYKAIEKATEFIRAIEDKNFSEDPSNTKRNRLVAEAKALRGYFYFWLAETFGKIHIVDNFTPEEINRMDSTPAEYEDVWNYIIVDFDDAAQELDWTPSAERRYDRCTKGMALSYLGESYMWKAHYVKEKEQECYQKAYDVFKRIINSGPYELNPSYSSLWDNAGRFGNTGWNKETIWQTTVDNGYLDWPARILGGDEQVMNFSWELLSDFENYQDGVYAGSFDKRRDASMCVAGVSSENQEKGGFSLDGYWYAGENVFCKQPLSSYDNFRYRDGSDVLPAVWGLKYWRALSRQAKDASTTIYWMRYANVLLDCAECCFKLNKQAEGWGYVEQIRDRAFGNLEVGKDLSMYLTSYMRANGLSEYPIPFQSIDVAVPDAEEYYTGLKADKCFDAEVWKVAVNEERRKEFNGEPCLRAAFQRSGYLEDHINHIYPKNTLGPTDLNEPRTSRSFDFEYTDCKKLPRITYPF